ncbi:MAG: glycoside hydrolase family 3 protein, partial [Microbacterium sp.]|nr:glycoside hydrolase family 3 protein [Microbacterium sp.]
MRTRIAVPALIVALLLTGCAPDPTPTPTASPTTPSPTPTPTPTVDPIADLSLEQRVGQLFMVGTTTASANPATVSAITNQHVGSIFLHSGTRTSISQTAAVVGQFTALVSPATTGGIALWVSTDQEGGEVQVLSGQGFTPIPS